MWLNAKTSRRIKFIATKETKRTIKENMFLGWVEEKWSGAFSLNNDLSIKYFKNIQYYSQFVY